MTSQPEAEVKGASAKLPLSRPSIGFRFVSSFILGKSKSGFGGGSYTSSSISRQLDRRAARANYMRHLLKWPATLVVAPPLLLLLLLLLH